ncbi:MAG: tellurite resistance TerB family protein [Desulfobacterales bacterium]
MFNMSDLLGALTQSGMTKSTNERMKNALSAGGKAPDGLLSGLLGGSSGGGLGDALSKMLGGAGGSGIGGMLGNVLSDASRAVGGKRNLATGGIGALVGALLGGGGRSMGGALGGGVMALLGAMAFSALKKSGQPADEVPVGLQEAKTDEEKKELEREAGLIFQAMINAAKADGQIDQNELNRIVGKLGEMGIDSDAKEFVIGEMQKPMNTDALVNAATGRPGLGAQLYAASLLAIEVDTPAEQAYMRSLGERLGLNPATIAELEQTIGIRSA